MELEKFIANFAAQFEDTDSTVFNPDTKFRDLEEWDSLIVLSIIAMVDEEYNVSLKGDDIRNSQTIKELYEIINSRL